jgi:hypothetical protein
MAGCHRSLADTGGGLGDGDDEEDLASHGVGITPIASGEALAVRSPP